MCAILDNYDRVGLFFLPFLITNQECHTSSDSATLFLKRCKKPSPISFWAGTLPVPRDSLKVNEKSTEVNGRFRLRFNGDI